MNQKSPGVSRFGAVTVNPAGARSTVTLPGGRVLSMDANEARIFLMQVEHTGSRVAFNTIIRGAAQRCW